MKRRLLINLPWVGLPIGKGGFLSPPLGRRLLLSAFFILNSVIAFSQLSGTKTINPSGSGPNNYTTFTSAVNDLIAKGVNGPVTFNVSNGTYTEQISIPAITGSSAVNTITFQSLANDSTAATLVFNTPAAANYVVQLQNADNIIFRKLTVQSSSTTYGNAVTFNIVPSSTAEDCQNIQILNCRLSSYWFVSDANAVVRVVGKSTGLKVKNNAIGHTYGIYINGQSTLANYTTGIEIDDNVFATALHPNGGGTTEAFEPIYVQYTNGMKIRGNRFTKTGCCADDLIQIYNSEAPEISGNRSDMSGGQYCITLSGVNVNGTTPANVYNNYFRFSYSGGQLIRILGSRYTNIYHNNMLYDATGSNNVAIFVNNSATGLNNRIYNNIISVNNGIPVVIDRKASVVEMNYNVYWQANAGNPIATIEGASYADLVALKDKVYAGSDANSLYKDPQYTAATNLDPKTPCMVGKVSGLAADIYGVSRPSSPTIGAKEVVGTLINDIGVEDVTSPLTPIAAPGLYDVVAQIRNYGTNTVNTYDVNYKLNNGTPVTSSIVTPLAPCQLTAVTFNGAKQANLTSSNSIAVYTSNPNGISDVNKLNDTIKRNICSPLAGGSYTIDPAGSGPNNFISFTAAVDRLNCGGISGAVTFTVAATTFNEQVSLNRVLGATASNTITFIGTDSTTSIIQFTGTAAARYVIRLNGARHVTIKKLNIKALSTTNGIGVAMSQGADSNSVHHCIIDIAGTTNSNTACIVMSGDGNTVNDNASKSFFISIHNNILNNGYYGVTMYNSSGMSATSPKGTVISKNVFNNTYYYGIYGGSVDATIKDNIINMNTGNANNYGVWYQQFYQLILERNTIRGNYQAVYFYTGYTASTRSKIINNIIVNPSSTNVNSAALQIAAFNTDIFHNTIVHTGTQGAALRFQYFTTGTIGYNLQNNIISASNGALAVNMNIYNNINPGVTSWDWDNIYSASANYATHYDNMTGVTTTFTNLASLKATYPAFFMNSKSERPTFVSATNMHLANTYDAPSGPTITGITTDVDGDVRCVGAPTLGADQSTYPQPTPTSIFVVADSVYKQSGTRIVNTTKGEPAKYTYAWYVDGVYANNQRDLDFEFNSTGTYNVSLVVIGCSGRDSSTQSLTVINPTSTPISDFVADKQIVDMYAIVNLRDNSKYGPNTWEWSAAPGANAFFSAQTDQHPYVFFGAPGFYDICLKTENDNGPGKDTCKNGYIFVKEEFNMCGGGANITTINRYGKLFDDGAGGNYTANRNCTFLIDPCATSVNLKFSQFNLASGDSLLIHNGTSASSPLIGAYVGTAIPGGTAGLTASSGKMFIRWKTDASNVAAGFAAEWSSVADNTVVPVADFSVPDTIFTDETAVFTSTSTGSNIKYAWDFDPPFEQAGGQGGAQSFDTYVYPVDGPYNVKLRVYNCAGSHSITKVINVIQPSTTPKVDFVADRVLAPVNGVIQFTNKTTQGPIAYKWVITPSLGVTITPNSTSKNISASFIVPGMYSVKLIAFNSIGTDSLEKVAYIKIYDYCDPGVAAIDGKVGISNVTFGAINNTTASGTTKYSNYITLPQFASVAKGGTYPISIARTNTVDEMNRRVWIDWNIDGDFDDSLEMVTSESAARTLVFNGNITVPRTASEGKTRMRVGVSYGNNANKPCGLNPVGEFEDYTVEVTDDKVLPVITLNGSPVMNVEQWYQYVEPGFTATDNVDGNITSKVTVTSTVDSTVVGVYTVKYEVTDLAGNTSVIAIRTVNVTPDVTLPMIALNGTATVNHRVKTTYTDAGATATDYFNRNFTSSIIANSTVNDQKVGTYMVNYEVTDLAGNKNTITRTVIVMDDVAPVISKVGDTVFVEVKNPYTEPGVSATDNYDASVNVISGTVNVNTTGKYTLTYEATDSAGNKTTDSRIVVVRDTEAPVIKISGLDTIIVDVFTNYNEQGATVTDNYCPNLTATITSPVVNINRVGNYAVTYEVTDCEGNAAITKTRIVKVVDRVAPVIQLKGVSSTTRIMRWQPYTDAGATYTDNYYSVAELTPNLVTTSNVNTQWEGVYEYCYDLVDPSGNVAQRVCRKVEVIANTTGIEEAAFNNAVNVYPNPTRGELNIAVKFDQQREVKITVMNLLGEVVATIDPHTVTENSYKMDMSSFAAGLYMVRVESDGMTVVKKVNLVN